MFHNRKENDRKHAWFFPCFLVGMLVLVYSSAWAQVSTGTVSGTVSDSTGAVVPGAVVAIRSAETGVTRSVTTDESGRYRAPQLGLGVYEITAQAQGFQTVVRSGITLTVGQEAVVNFSLQVGAVAERIEVTGEAPLVETTTATTSGLVNEATVRDLPLNGRSFTDLMDLNAGVQKVTIVRGTSRVTGFGAQFSVGGSHPVQNSYLLDGVNLSDSRTATPGSASGNVLGTDTIREFRMLTSNYSAEYGQVSGGVMTAVSKSGTNAIHGSAFEYLRNSALDARRFFDVGGVPPFKRNQFGFTVGGPIVRDRSFFFGSYEGLRERLATTQTFRTATADARRGVLPSGPCSIAPCTVGTRARQILNLLPLPNSRSFGDGTADYVSAVSDPTSEDYFTVRLDHNFNENHFMYGRYTFDDGSSDNSTSDGVFVETRTNRYHNAALGLTSLLSPALLNTFRVGFNRQVPVENFQTVDESTDVSALEHVPGRGPGGVSITGLTGLSTNGIRPGFYWWTSFQYVDDLNYTRGNHSLKFGAALQRNRDNQDTHFNFRGSYQFASYETFYAQTPNLLNVAVPGANALRGLRTWVVGTYLQDDWKARSNLTVNLGVRFELATVPTEVNGKIATVPDFIRDTTVTVGGPLYERQSAFLYLSPRVGIAWDPFGDGKTSIRSGFGIFQEQVHNTDFALPASRMPPFWGNTLLRPVPGSPVLYPDAFANFGPGLQAILPRLETIQFKLDQAYKMNWSFDMQREVLPNTLLSLGYVGARGVHLLASWADANSPANVLSADGRRYNPLGAPRLNPNFTQHRHRFSGNDSYYQSLRIGMQKRFSRGFQMNSSYTWSKSLDTSSIKVSGGTEFANADTESFPLDTKANKGPSSWDLRHYWVTNYSLDLPFGPGKALGGDLTGVGAKLLEGWSLGGILSLTTGAPFSATISFDYAAA
ncbi:MAG: TonB-dependent receptor, partial [Acidobacteria bacterium]|nr:TonB-dependent receptor [Acidobacteriota bacterium]